MDQNFNKAVVKGTLYAATDQMSIPLNKLPRSNSSSTYSRTTLTSDRNTQEQQKSVKSRLSLPNKSGSGSIRITTTNRSMR